MKEAQKNYKKQCKQKIITFYKHDDALHALANAINFQGFVKEALKALLVDEKGVERWKK